MYGRWPTLWKNCFKNKRVKQIYRSKTPLKKERNAMKIGIIGAGNIGSTAAKLFVNAGHQVAISNSRGADSLNDLVADLGDNAESASVEEAIDFGDIVFIAIPFGKYKEIPADGFEGKIVIDANNYYPDRDGRFPELDDGTTT